MHIYHILYIKYILHISYSAYFAHYNSYSLYFPLAGHSDRLNIFKSAAFYSLSDEELEEIVSCKNEPVLKAYMHGLFRAACRLWKYVMPVDSKAVFQNDVFHPATVSPKLQNHLGLTLAQRIFDKYVGIICEYFEYFAYLTYFAYSVGLARDTSTFALHSFPRPRRMRPPKEELKGL